uniref:Putative tick kunitz 61 n=1 Tax=Ixodes ricinus TaxID=34613 RepID=V5HLA4_IXORI
MKATIAVLCFLVAVAYTIVVEAKRASPPIDDDALNPRCVEPPNCPGNFKSVYFYNSKRGCVLVKLGENCTDNNNYKTYQECNEHCPPAPGTRPGRA